MGGSNSIKAVLPALFPNDPELDYHALEGVHNGGEAMSAFAALADMDAEERAVTREQLLRYCELDTYAMVKIWQKLCEAVDRWGLRTVRTADLTQKGQSPSRHWRS